MANNGFTDTEKTNVLFKKLMSTISTNHNTAFFDETSFPSNKNIFSSSILQKTPSNTPTYSGISVISDIQAYLQNDDPNITINSSWYNSKSVGNTDTSKISGFKIDSDGLLLRMEYLKLDYINNPADTCSFACMDATGSRNILKNLLPPTFGSPGDFGQNLYYSHNNGALQQIYQLGTLTSLPFGAPLVDSENGIITFYDINDTVNPGNNFTNYNFYITCTKYVGSKGVSSTSLENPSDGSIALQVDSNGNVDISGGMLTVKSSSGLRLTNTAIKQNANERIGYIDFNNGGSGNGGAAIESCINVGGASNNADLRFITSYEYGSTYLERMRIDREGRVGIGITNPAYTLDVSGNTHIAKDLAACAKENTQLLITPNSVTSNDAGIEIRGHKGGSTDSKHSQLLFTNYDANSGTPGATSSIHYLGGVYGKVTNATSNIGSLCFGTSADGSTLSERMTIDSSGNVDISGGMLTGITDSIYFKINNKDYSPSSGEGDQIRLRDDGDVYITSTLSSGSNYKGIRFSNGTSEVMRITQGNVGIGTTTASGLLHLHKQFASDVSLNPAGNLKFSTNNSLVSWDCGEIEAYIAANNNPNASFNTDGYPGGLAFKTKSADNINTSACTTKMVLDASGNLGIGTTEPNAGLQVKNDNGLTVSGTADTGIRTAVLRLGTPYASNNDAYCAKITSTNNHSSNYNSDLRFYTSNGNNASATEAMSILSNGNVDIGSNNGYLGIELIDTYTISHHRSDNDDNNDADGMHDYTGENVIYRDVSGELLFSNRNKINCFKILDMADNVLFGGNLFTHSISVRSSDYYDLNLRYASSGTTLSNGDLSTDTYYKFQAYRTPPRLVIANERTADNEFTALRLSNKGADHRSARSIFDFVVQDIVSSSFLGSRKMSIRFRQGLNIMGDNYDSTEKDLMMFDGVNQRVGINTTSPLTRMQVNHCTHILGDQYTGSTKQTNVHGSYYDTQHALLVSLPDTPTSNTALNDPRDAIVITRKGTANQAWQAQAHFRISRYENPTTDHSTGVNQTDSRTRLDFALLHGSGNTSHVPPSNKMTLYSNGLLEVNGYIKINGADFVLNAQGRRQKSDGSEPNLSTTNRRALVHGPGDQLIINYGGDYTGNGDSTNPVTPVYISSACHIAGVCSATSFSGNATSATTAAGLSDNPTINVTNIQCTASTRSYTSADKISLYTSKQEYGLGLDGSTTTYHSGSNHKFYSGAKSSVATTQTLVMTIANTAGNVTILGTCSAASFNATSDIRLKENIEKLDSDLMLNKITSLNGVSFEFKKNLGKRYLGVIAQDVEKQFPDLVSEGNGNEENKENEENEKYKNVNYDGFVGPFIECIKSLQNKIDEKDKEMEKMSKEMEKEKAKTAKLEKQMEYLLEKVKE